MLNIEDLNLKPDEAPDVEASEAEPVGPAALDPDSATAKALYAAWSGEPVVIVNSPPGAGKTQLFATVVSHLSQRTELAVVGSMPTRDQVVGDANRLAEQVPAERIVVAMSGPPNPHLREGIESRSTALTSAAGGMPTHHVELRTLASGGRRPSNCNILVVDEAYQATFAAVAEAARRAEQVILIGDPGQIGPVVTVDTGGWEHRRMAPHHRAPEVFSKMDGAVTVNLTSSWRLGKRSTEAIAPLYDFEFDSARPHREIFGLEEIESFVLPEPQNPYDPQILTIVAEHAAALCETTLIEGDVERPMTEQDVAVVVSHNAQVSGVSGLLHSMGVYGVTVGTADRLQGGQWHAVVAIDPFVGHGEGLSPHSLSLGRLCVMASRHATHLSWFHDGTWAQAIEEASLPKKVTKRAVTVREKLCAV